MSKTKPRRPKRRDSQLAALPGSCTATEIGPGARSWQSKTADCSDAVHAPRHPRDPSLSASRRSTPRAGAPRHEQLAPLVCNSLGQLGPDLVRFLWRLADHAARNHIPPDLRALPILDPADQSHLQAFKRLRGHIYVQSTYKLLAAIFEGVTERIYGRTFTLKTLPRHQEIIAARSEPWLPSRFIIFMVFMGSC